MKSLQIILCIGALGFTFFLLLRNLFWQKKTAQLLEPKKNPGRFLLHFSLVKKIVHAMLLFLGTAALAIALLRPSWGDESMSVTQEGRDIIIALDVSKSMMAQDVAPHRLTRAKEKIKELVRSLSAERVGLMIFAGSAFMLCPLTNDFDAFFMFLDSIDAQTLLSGTTAIDAALNEALEIFEKMNARKSKLLLIVTDGEDFSERIDALKQRIIDDGLTVFTLGIGTTKGAPIPLYDADGSVKGFQKDDNDAIVISRLNEPLLQELAQKTHGRYFSVTDSSQDIRAIEKELKKFEKERYEDKKIVTRQEKYHYFALISFICLLLDLFL